MRVARASVLAALLLNAGASLCHAQQAVEADPAALHAARPKSCGESFPRSATAEFNRQCIALAGVRAAMRGNALVIRLDDGTRKTFNNKDSAGASADAFGYGLADFYPSTHIFVVTDYGPDDGKSIAINGRTGRQWDFDFAFPQFSPDGNWVLAITYSGEEETDSSFAILDVHGQEQREVWSSKTAKPGLPAKAKYLAWDNDTTIRLEAAGQKPVFLIRAGDGRWAVRRTPG